MTEAAEQLGEKPVVDIIAPHLIEEAWPVIGPHIAEALKWSDDELHINDIKAGLMDESDNMLCFVITIGGQLYGVCTVDLLVYPSGKRALNVMTMTGVGTREYSEELTEAMEKLARASNCTEIVTSIRPDKAERLAEIGGFVALHVVMKRRVEV